MQRYALAGITLLFAALPATSNYKLNSYGFGSGTGGTKTTTYSLEGVSGELNGQTGNTSNTGGQPGFVQTEHANVPLIAADNGSGLYYNKLHFVIDNQNNPTDAKFLVSVSTDNFAANTTYVQPDGTLSTSLSTSDYQTYSAWGSSSGSFVIGLLPSTNYYLRVRATQGTFSESAFSPTDGPVPTAAPSLTFSLQTSSGPTPPYTVSLGTLSAGTVNTSAQTINTSLSTNGTTGGNVYITGANGGLLSASQAHKINSVSNDLTSLTDGFGAQNNSVTQTSGGPYSVLSPYNGSGNTVGIVDATTRSLYTSANPVTAGAGVLVLKAKAASTDVAATDYSETLTFTASANF